ncbi:MAG: HRDC domain-containing protein [Candidatus Omnitrophota bacterium]
MECHTEPISSREDLARLANHLNTRKTIAFDTEFIREKTFFPMLEIIQIATEEDSWLIDAQPYRRLMDKSIDDSPLQPILAVLADPDILKIVHAAQGDQECLYASFGVVAAPILDTSIAAALCGYGESIGLGNLLKAVLNVAIKKGHARTDWSARPLPRQLIHYAHEDVIHLVELGSALLEELDQRNRREWAVDLSNQWDEAQFEPNPEALVRRLAKNGRINPKNYPILLELVRWREERVRQLNLPRRWLAADEILINLAEVRPKDLEHLKAFRGLSKNEINRRGEEILKIIDNAEKSQGVVMPDFQHPTPPSLSESRAVELLRCYVGILAASHKIASAHLVDPGFYLDILRQAPKTMEDLVKNRFLTPYGAKLIGDEIIAFLQGQRALAVQNSALQVIKLP